MSPITLDSSATGSRSAAVSRILAACWRFRGARGEAIDVETLGSFKEELGWDVALKYAHKPVKQAVISPSALSLMYPADAIPGYPREQFLHDLLREHEGAS